MKMNMYFIIRIKQKICRHNFDLSQLKKTNIPELEPPKTRGYKEWEEYFSKLYKHESHIKRVKWPCSKCGKIFYAHCGLDISPEYGSVIRRKNPIS